MMAKTVSLSLLGLFLAVSPPLIADPIMTNHVEAELLTRLDTVRPGVPFLAGVRLKLEPSWKIYWQNPGDAGLPTTVQWRLPDGALAGKTLWPYPKQFDFQGLVSYGYDQEAVLLAEITPAEGATPGTPFPLQASVSWLACKDLCIRGSIDLSKQLRVTGGAVGEAAYSDHAIDAAQKRIPVGSSAVRAMIGRSGDRQKLTVVAELPIFASVERVSFFPLDSGKIASSIPLASDWSSTSLNMVHPLADGAAETATTVEGVLVLHLPDGESAYELTASAEVVSSSAGTQPTTGEAAEVSLSYMLLLAMLGGLLLNLMPCVFPVLSLKAIKLVEARNLSGSAHRLHGIAYTLGVMSFFSLVAVLLFMLKASGAGVGWGFQLQTPWFVALLVYLLFVLGLNFSGLLQFGTGVMGLGDSLTRKGGYQGSYFTGVLAAVVASPCTAPFMGSAVAFAITQPLLQANLIFLALAFGMALPFLLIAFIPHSERFLPKLGPWMNYFKQAMAFPLYLTAIWLLWVLGRQTDATSMAVILGGILLLCFAAWLKNCGPVKHPVWRCLKTGVSLSAMIAALALLGLPALATRPGSAAVETQIGDFWEPYSEPRLVELRQRNRPVFVNMTPDWCISCIANERVALSMPSVRAAFREKGVVPMKGDWTNNDPRITAVLESFNRQGVPLYIFYPGSGGAPVLLPQWLTPSNVLVALEAI